MIHKVWPNISKISLQIDARNDGRCNWGPERSYQVLSRLYAIICTFLVNKWTFFFFAHIPTAKIVPSYVPGRSSCLSHRDVPPLTDSLAPKSELVPFKGKSWLMTSGLMILAIRFFGPSWLSAVSICSPAVGTREREIVKHMSIFSVVKCMSILGRWLRAERCRFHAARRGKKKWIQLR